MCHLVIHASRWDHARLFRFADQVRSFRLPSGFQRVPSKKAGLALAFHSYLLKGRWSSSDYAWWNFLGLKMAPCEEEGRTKEIEEKSASIRQDETYEHNKIILFSCFQIMNTSGKPHLVTTTVLYTPASTPDVLGFPFAKHYVGKPRASNCDVKKRFGRSKARIASWIIHGIGIFLYIYIYWSWYMKYGNHCHVNNAVRQVAPFEYCSQEPWFNVPCWLNCSV